LFVSRFEYIPASTANEHYTVPLGLLKKLVSDPSSCQNVMSVSVDGCSLLTCLKRLLLWKTDVLQTSVCQILQQILDKPNRQSYCQAVLESDLLGVCSKVFPFLSPF